MRSATPQSKRKKFFSQDNQLTCEASDSPRRLLWANGITLAELDTSKKASQILQSDNANTALRSIPEGLPQNYSPYGFLQTTPFILSHSAGSDSIQCCNVMHLAMDADSIVPDQDDFSRVIINLRSVKVDLMDTAIARTTPSIGMTQMDNGDNG